MQGRVINKYNTEEIFCEGNYAPARNKVLWISLFYYNDIFTRSVGIISACKINAIKFIRHMTSPRPLLRPSPATWHQHKYQYKFRSSISIPLFLTLNCWILEPLAKKLLALILIQECETTVQNGRGPLNRYKLRGTNWDVVGGSHRKTSDENSRLLFTNDVDLGLKLCTWLVWGLGLD